MKIILFRGRPASGKTTISKALSLQLGLPVIHKDDIYDSLVPFIADHAARNKAAHDILYAMLESNAHADSTIILDFPFQNAADFSVIESWCAHHQATLKSVLVTCTNESLWRERLILRSQHPLPNQMIYDFDELKGRYGSMHVEPHSSELLVDSALPLDGNIQHVIDYI
jgi:adenylate kinase family enzyme